MFSFASFLRFVLPSRQAHSTTLCGAKMMGGRFALVLGALGWIVLAPLATRAQNNALVNGGGFEAPTYTAAPFYGYQPANSPWTWSGVAGVQRNGSLGASAPEGVQTAFVQGSGAAGNQGTFSQNVTLAVGTYRVTFKGAQWKDGPAVPIQIQNGRRRSGRADHARRPRLRQLRFASFQGEHGEQHLPPEF